MIYQFVSKGHLYEVHLEKQGNSYQAVIEGKTYQLEVLDEEPGFITVDYNGRTHRLAWAEQPGKKWISIHGCTYLLEKPATRASPRQVEITEKNQVRAPIPAQVRSVEVLVGDRVIKGQTLLLLEAMKMEIRITASTAGQVQQITVRAGQAVNRDDLLVSIE